MSENLIDADDTDALAAEYVLGTLDPEERMAAKRLLDDSAFATKVKVWERRLGELHLMVEPVEPDPAIWQRIKAKLPEPPPGSVIALPEVAPEPEPAPRPESGAEPHGHPEPQPMPEAEPQFQPVPLAEPKAEAKSASGAQPEFWPELERALLEAQNALAAGQSPPKETESTVAPPIEPVAGEAQAVPAPSEAEPIEERSESIEAAGRSTETIALRPSGDTTAAPPLVPSEPVAPPVVRPPEGEEKSLRVLQRRLARWRAFAFLMILAALAVAALLALWKFAPERVPAALQPAELLQRIGVRIEVAPGSRPSGPPEPQFEE